MRYIKYIFLVSLLFLVSGCNLFGPTPEEEIYNHLEKAVSLEEEFENQQTPLVTLEKKEQDIYNEIVKLGMAEFEKIQTLSTDAIDTVNKREEHINKEKRSLEASQVEFEKTKALIDQIENTATKEKAQELYDVMENRYKAYENLYASYMTSIKLDKELYELFKKEELTLEELEAQIKKVNDSYSDVVKGNEEFNKYTERYNEIKKEFYKLAELNVSFEN